MDYAVHGILQAILAGVGSLSFLQGTFPTQRLNPGLPHYRQILYQVSHKGRPRIVECGAIHTPADLPDPGIEPHCRHIIYQLSSQGSPGEALYSQHKPDWELTVAQIMNSLLPNSELN